MSELVSAAHSNLERLGLAFKKHEGKEFVEFEVAEPARFIVRITHLAEMEYPSPLFGVLMNRRLPEATDLRIVFTDAEQAARHHSAELVKGILASLRRPPWEGLGFIPSMTAKSMWSRAAQGLE